MSVVTTIPVIDLVKEYEALKPEIDRAVGRVLSSGHFVLGPEGAAFEKELAAYTQVPEAIGLNSGTDALILALRALEIGAEDEVIVPALTFFATAEAVALVGAKPVFADIDPVTFNIQPADVSNKITSKTKAIIAVHLYGQPADVTALQTICKDKRLALIEDMAQGLGATCGGRPVGGFGQIACLSFYPTKNLGAAGDAGAVLTKDPQLAATMRRLRNHGADRKYFHDEVGYNSRLDEIQAAILRVKLPHLNAWTQARVSKAARYSEAFADLPTGLPKTAPGRTHSFHLYTIRVQKREAFQEALLKEGIQTALHYPQPMHLQKAFASLGGQVGDCPHAEKAAAEVVSLPLYPQLSDADQARIITTVQKVAAHA